MVSFGGVYSHYATHRLIVRRNDHVARRLRFLSYLWHALAERADEAGRRTEVQDGLDNLARIHAQIQAYERTHTREPALWTILRAAVRSLFAVSVVVFSARMDETGEIAAGDSVAQVAVLIFMASAVGSIFVGSMINHFLHQDFRFLDAWERSYGENALWVFGRLGTELATPSRTPSGREAVPPRNTALYVILSIVTLGLFSIFWRYTVMADGNEHFQSDATMENVIAAGLRGTTIHGGVVPPPALP